MGGFQLELIWEYPKLWGEDGPLGEAELSLLQQYTERHSLLEAIADSFRPALQTRVSEELKQLAESKLEHYQTPSLEALVKAGIDMVEFQLGRVSYSIPLKRQKPPYKQVIESIERFIQLQEVLAEHVGLGDSTERLRLGRGAVYLLSTALILLPEALLSELSYAPPERITLRHLSPEPGLVKEYRKARHVTINPVSLLSGATPENSELFWLMLEQIQGLERAYINPAKELEKRHTAPSEKERGTVEVRRTAGGLEAVSVYTRAPSVRYKSVLENFVSLISEIEPKAGRPDSVTRIVTLPTRTGELAVRIIRNKDGIYIWSQHCRELLNYALQLDETRGFRLTHHLDIRFQPPSPE